MKFFSTTILSVALLFSLSACDLGSSNDSTSKKQIQPKTTTDKSENSHTNNSSTGSTGTTKQGSGTANQPDTKSESDINNIKDVKGFTPNDNQSFTVDLKSWGNVKFVSGKITGGNHIPTVFYLTNAKGDILYSFNDSPYPYNVDFKAVSFEDVNKDGLKDIIMIVSDNDNAGKPIAAFWSQNANKTFTCDTKRSQDLNNSGNNTDIKTVRDYLSKKF